MHKVQLPFYYLVGKRKKYSRVIEDEEFQGHEGWMENCLEEFMTMGLNAKMTPVE